jgi:hypothetical protein
MMIVDPGLLTGSNQTSRPTREGHGPQPGEQVQVVEDREVELASAQAVLQPILGVLVEVHRYTWMAGAEAGQQSRQDRGSQRRIARRR